MHLTMLSLTAERLSEPEKAIAVKNFSYDYDGDEFLTFNFRYRSLGESR